MGETINKETVAAAPGATEPPAQPTSDNTTEPSAIDVEAMKAIYEPMIQAEVERRTQSVKDKRIAKQESRISGLEDTLAQLKELKDEGLSEKLAIQFLEMREQLGGPSQVVPADAPPATEPAAQATVAVDEYLSATLKAIGLNSGEADVVEILQKESDPIKRLTAIGELAETRRQAQVTNPNPANVITSGGGASVSEDTLETVTAELEAEQAKPIRDRERVIELSEKHKKLLPRN